MHFPSFKTYVMFVTCISFHLKCYVCDKHSPSFKTLVMFVMCILFHWKHLQCSPRHILILHCTLYLAMTIFSQKIFQKVKINDCFEFMPSDFRPFVVQCSVKIAGHWLQPKPLIIEESKQIICFYFLFSCYYVHIMFLIWFKNQNCV